MKSANIGGKAFDREALRAQLKSFGGVWLKWTPSDRASRHGHCDWCHNDLNQEDVDAYVDFCMALPSMLSGKDKIPEPFVFCIDCAGGAISELIDGIKFSPNARPSTEPHDPWSRPRWTPDQGERYP